jgi:TonB family protein
VKLKVVIDDSGHTRSATVIKGAPDGLDAVAASTIKKWAFQPATKDENPVTVCVPIEVTFHLY